MLVVANFFTVNVHHTQTGQVDLYFDTTTDYLLELEHRTQALQNWAVELRKLATANKALHSVGEMWDQWAILYVSGHKSQSLASKFPKFSMNNNHLSRYPHTKKQ